MIPRLQKRGKSFREACRYVLRDPQAKTSERVAWAETRNLSAAPEDAWLEMFGTYKDQARLKEAAGLDARGRKNTNPVLHYTLSWAHSDNPSAEHMRDTALDSIRALGLSDHQALIVGHSDKKHLHVHIVANTVHPLTGETAKLKFTKLDLSRWAEAYEREHGIHCEQRIENNADRETLRQLRANERAEGRQPSAYVPIGDRSPDRNSWLERRALGALLATGNKDPVDRAFEALTRHEAIFTRQDMARMANLMTKDANAFGRLMAQLEGSKELVSLGEDGRYTTRTMMTTEAMIAATADVMASEKSHPLTAAGIRLRSLCEGLNDGQQKALEHITGPEALACVVGHAGTGKSTMLRHAHEVWAESGFTVRGAALSGVAKQSLQDGSGIASTTLAALQMGLANNSITFTPKDILVIDEAGMVGSRQMREVLMAAHKGGAKVVLVGDPEQLQAIEAGAPFRHLTERIGAANITDILRQREAWQRDATAKLATGAVDQALSAYEQAGLVQQHDTTDAAISGLLAGWRQSVGTGQPPDLILAGTRSSVAALNAEARSEMRKAGLLGDDHVVTAIEERLGEPTRKFALELAKGDRLVFTKNDNNLDVHNGTLGTLERIDRGSLVIRLDGDGKNERRVRVDLNHYRNLAHGYAMTIHKSQGVTVDRAHVLAEAFMDRHMAYVAMSRHRDSVALHYGKDVFETRAVLARRLSRERTKESTFDYMAEELPARLKSIEQSAKKRRSQETRDSGKASVSRSEQIKQSMLGWRRRNKGRDFGMEL